ncbi:hypothetical protein JW711_03575 [Candidatus Woesearchaeota archaeon]|nr:hypothetical protein [Candidatus Woesearchaeota archaeon]
MVVTPEEALAGEQQWQELTERVDSALIRKLSGKPLDKTTVRIVLEHTLIPGSVLSGYFVERYRRAGWQVKDVSEEYKNILHGTILEFSRRQTLRDRLKSFVGYSTTNDVIAHLKPDGCEGYAYMDMNAR